GGGVGKWRKEHLVGVGARWNDGQRMCVWSRIVAPGVLPFLRSVRQRALGGDGQGGAPFVRWWRPARVLGFLRRKCGGGRKHGHCIGRAWIILTGLRGCPLVTSRRVSKRCSTGWRRSLR